MEFELFTRVTLSHVPKMPVCATCNQQKRGRLDNNNVCKECRDAGNGSAPAPTLADVSDVPPLPENWKTAPISALLGGHLLLVINQNMKPMHDILTQQTKQIAELQESKKKLEDDNKDLKQRLKIAETKVKNLELSETKVKTVVTRQQAYIVKQDKMCRLKNILIAGLSETESLLHNEEEASTDKGKVEMILKAIGKDEVDVAHCRRVGNEDQGHEGRGRFLLVEFTNQTDRNSVRNASDELSHINELKHIRMKADLTKEEREEYRRLYSSRDTLAASHPDEVVRVDKGKLYVGNNMVDQLNTTSKIF